jgi:hypothetical protein
LPEPGVPAIKMLWIEYQPTGLLLFWRPDARSATMKPACGINHRPVRVYIAGVYAAFCCADCSATSRASRLARCALLRSRGPRLRLGGRRGRGCTLARCRHIVPKCKAFTRSEIIYSASQCYIL